MEILLYSLLNSNRISNEGLMDDTARKVITESISVLFSFVEGSRSFVTTNILAVSTPALFKSSLFKAEP